MDLQLVRKGLLDYTRKKKRWVLLLVALGCSGYGAYKVCNLPSLARKRQRLSRLLGALISVAEVISDSAETVGVISRDFKDFLQSEEDKIPNSLRQISKIARSNEFSESVVGLTQALTAGILRGFQSSSRIDQNVSAAPNFLDKVLDKLSSPAGSGLISLVVGSFAKNLVMTFYQDVLQPGRVLHTNSSQGESSTNEDLVLERSSVSRWVDVVCSDKSKMLIGDCIELFVSTAVAVFLDKTMHINPYDEIFAGLTNPKHQEQVRDVVVSVCSGAVETLVKTSHQVLTSSNSSVDSKSSPPCLAIEEVEDEQVYELSGNKEFSDGLISGSGWFGKVSSTLTVPSNRRFVLDVTGRVTFEMVRSLLEFLLETLCHGVSSYVDAIHEVVDTGLEVMRFVNAKSSVVATVTLSFWLHVLDGPWILVPN